MTQPRLRLLAGLILLLPLFAHPQGRPLDTPNTPQIRLLDRHHRHPTGTGFLLELNLGVFQVQADTLVLQPVNKVDPTYAMQRPDYRLPDRTRNPLVGLFYGIAAFGELARRPTRLPLPLQLVIPLDSGVVLDETGNLLVLRRPSNGRIRLFIPQLLVEDGATLFLTSAAEGETFHYVQSQPLYTDRVLPDIELTLKGTEPGRYLGAQGQWVTMTYLAAIPPQLGGASEQMTLQVLLNARYQVPNPQSKGPYAWPSVNGTTGEIRCFVPDALARPDSMLALEVQLIFGGRILSSRQQVVLHGTPPTQRLSLHFIDIQEQTRPAKSPGEDFADYYVLYLVGGTCVHASSKADDDASTHLIKAWKDPLPAELPLGLGDEVGILVCDITPDWFYGGHVLYIQLPAAAFPAQADNLAVTRKFKRFGVRYRWILRAEYEWLDGLGE